MMLSELLNRFLYDRIFLSSATAGQGTVDNGCVLERRPAVDVAPRHARRPPAAALPPRAAPYRLCAYGQPSETSWRRDLPRTTHGVTTLPRGRRPARRAQACARRGRGAADRGGEGASRCVEGGCEGVERERERVNSCPSPCVLCSAAVCAECGRVYSLGDRSVPSNALWPCGHVVRGGLIHGEDRLISHPFCKVRVRVDAGVVCFTSVAHLSLSLSIYLSLSISLSLSHVLSLSLSPLCLHTQARRSLSPITGRCPRARSCSSTTLNAA